MVIASGPYSMPAGTNAGAASGISSILQNPEMQKILLQGGLGILGGLGSDEKNKQNQLLQTLGQMNPAQNLQGMQTSFGMPNMQSVNGLLGR